MSPEYSDTIRQLVSNLTDEELERALEDIKRRDYDAAEMRIYRGSANQKEKNPCQ